MELSQEHRRRVGEGRDKDVDWQMREHVDKRDVVAEVEGHGGCNG